MAHYKCLKCSTCIWNALTCRPHCEPFPVRTVTYSFSFLLCILMLHAHMHSCCNAAMPQCKRCANGIRASQAKALLIKLTPRGVVFSFLFFSHRQKLSAGGTAGGDGAEVWPYASAGHRGICPSTTLDPDRHLEVCLMQT